MVKRFANEVSHYRDLPIGVPAGHVLRGGERFARAVAAAGEGVRHLLNTSAQPPGNREMLGSMNRRTLGRLL